MKKLAIISLVGVSIIGCSQQQRTVVEPVQPVYQPSVSNTGTCMFGSKSGSTSTVTTHNDCMLKGGEFMPSSTTTYPTSTTPTYGTSQQTVGTSQQTVGTTSQQAVGTTSQQTVGRLGTSQQQASYAVPSSAVINTPVSGTGGRLESL